MKTEDITDKFKDIYKQRKARRAANRKSAPDLLVRNGVRFSAHNNGAHLVVQHNNVVADLWPGTGRYQVRGTSDLKIGVFNLLHDLGISEIKR